MNRMTPKEKREAKEYWLVRRSGDDEWYSFVTPIREYDIHDDGNGFVFVYAVKPDEANPGFMVADTSLMMCQWSYKGNPEGPHTRTGKLRVLYRALSEPQQTLFDRMYPDGIAMLPEGHVERAIAQCERTLKKNRRAFNG